VLKKLDIASVSPPLVIALIRASPIAFALSNAPETVFIESY
jgi:hypothetical protein